MSILIPRAPAQQTGPVLYRLSVEQYHKLIGAGVLVEGSPIELLEGLLVRKMTIHPPHATSLQRTWKRIFALLSSGWTVRIQQPITLSDSEPEPDVAVARGDDLVYSTHHPGPADLGLVVEVADSSLPT